MLSPLTCATDRWMGFAYFFTAQGDFLPISSGTSDARSWNRHDR
jgi:hypothetical protein